MVQIAVAKGCSNAKSTFAIRGFVRGIFKGDV